MIIWLSLGNIWNRLLMDLKFYIIIILFTETLNLLTYYFMKEYVKLQILDLQGNIYLIVNNRVIDSGMEDIHGYSKLGTPLYMSP